MIFSFRPAVREMVGLLIGLAGGTGSGKTYSGMRLAAGIMAQLAPGKPFAVIDTEAGRAKHYAGQFCFDHGDLKPPFRPSSYAEAIIAADEAKYPVILVDSMSHVWAGDGGVLDFQEDELTRMAGDDWKKRENCKMAAWIKPKVEHKHMVQRLLQVRAHLILCFRAEEKIEMIRGENGKMQIVPKKTVTGLDGWVPICEKNLPFELTASFLLLATAPGIGQPIKLQEQHKALFPAGKPINEDSGKRIALWASGKSTTAASPVTSTGANPPSRPLDTATDSSVIHGKGELPGDTKSDAAASLPSPVTTAGPTTGQPPAGSDGSAPLVGPDGKLTDDTLGRLETIFAEKTTDELVRARKDCVTFLFAKGKIPAGKTLLELGEDTARSIITDKSRFFRAYEQWLRQQQQRAAA